MFGFVGDIIKSRQLLWKLTKYDFRQKYLQTYLGIVWAFVHPVVIIALLWFIFEVGFKAKPAEGVPFALWLMAGIVPWLFFADALTNASDSLTDNRFLVNKVVFRVSLLPMIKIFSSMVIHLFLMAFVLTAFWFYGFAPDLYALQLVYYLFALGMLLLAVSWMTSAVVVFLGDLRQLIAILIQVGFWATPVFWSLALIPERYHDYIRINPMVYVIDGYRNALIHKVWFWEDWESACYFWSVTLVLMAFGIFIFKKLKPYFADVL